jgi:hypothetical protein
VTDSSVPFDFAGSFVLREWGWEAPPEPRFRARSHYVERLWLPMIGPTALLLLRLLAELLDDAGDGQRVESGLVATALGVGGTSPGRQSPLARALRRLERFELVKLGEGGELMVRAELPLVSPRDLSRLPAWLQARHSHAVGP